MFPLRWNFPFRKKDGSMVNLEDAVSGEGYELPIAGENILGGVKIGDGVNIDANGKISVSGGGLDMKVKSVTVPQSSSSEHTAYLDFTPDEGYTPIAVSYEYSGGSPNSPYTIVSVAKRTYLSNPVWSVIFLCYSSTINISGAVHILEVKL